jgi:hypothetical protein
VYPRGPKKPPLCVQCAIAKSGVRSSAKNISNLSRREVKKRVRDAKGMQQPQPYVEAPPAASTERDFELTSAASFDQGWAVSWDEGRDPHPGYPEPVHVTWGNDPFTPPETETPVPPAATAPAAPVFAAAAPPPPPPPTPAPAPAPVAENHEIEPHRPPAAAPEPARTLPRLQQVKAEQPSTAHAPARSGGLPSVRPPLKPGGAETTRTPLPPLGGTPPVQKNPPKQGKPGSLQAASENAAAMPAQQPRPFGGAPATHPDAGAAPTAPPGRLRRKEPDKKDGNDMLGWLDELIGTEQSAADNQP